MPTDVSPPGHSLDDLASATPRPDAGRDSGLGRRSWFERLAGIGVAWSARISRLRDAPGRWRSAQIRRLAHATRPGARARVHSFKVMAVMPDDARRELTRILIHVAARVGLVKARSDRMLNVLIWLTMAAVLLSPYAVMRYYDQWRGWLAFAGIWYGSLMAFASVLFILMAPLLFFRTSKGSLVEVIEVFWLFFGLVTCGYAAYFLHGRLQQPDAGTLRLLAQMAFVQVCIYAVGAGVSILVVQTVLRAISLRLERSIPDAMFVDSILRALQIVRCDERHWQSLDSKNKLMRELERAARFVEEGLPRALAPADPQTETWLKDRCEGIAASLRAKKTWVCMPRGDTRRQLEDRLLKCLLDAALGRWDQLETAERHPISRQELKVRIRSFVVAAFVALLPATVYRGAQLGGFLSRAYQ